MANFDLIIRQGQCVVPDPHTPGQLRVECLDLGVKDGKIAALSDHLNSGDSPVIEARGLHVLPGLIDTQVHFREPGLEHKEDLATGTAGALMGGFTAVFEMPNTNPPTLDAIALADKISRAQGRSWCDIAFYMGASPTNVDKLEDLQNLKGCCGIKVFMGSSTGNLLLEGDELLDRVLAQLQRRAAFHCEDEGRLRERRHLVEIEGSHVGLHPVWRDEQTALLATQRLIRMAQKHQKQVHVLHVTTADEVELIARHKDLVSAECTPQHLTLAAPECYERLGSLAQMNPPIRDLRHQEALWKGINSRVIDVLGSDHSPHSLEEKQKPYPNSPSGMSGVQTMLPVMLNHVHQGRLSLLRLVELLAETPAQLFQLHDRGRIEVGRLAHLSLVDLKKQREITNSWLQSKSGWTAFAGMKVTGWPIMTLLRGQVVCRDDQLLGGPQGRLIDFEPLTSRLDEDQ